MDLVIELIATAEVAGTQLSEVAAELMVQELEKFPDAEVRGALSRCRREVKGRLTLAEIVSRLADGRPGADEAWAMLTWDEDRTVVLTEEVMYAQGEVWPTYQSGDKVGARFAFREAYVRLVNEAREARKPIEWQVSLGYDKAGREGPIREAIQKGRLTAKQAQQYLPAIEETQPRKQIESGEPVAMPAQVRALIGSMKPVDQATEKPKLRIEGVG